MYDKMNIGGHSIFRKNKTVDLEMFKEYFAKRRDMHNRSLRDLENLHVPEGYSGMALTTVKIKGANIWNEIPIEIRKIDETSSFKRAFKQHFISLCT